MRKETRENLARVLLWSPRILGFGMALYLTMFAMDAFISEKSLDEKLVDFFLHAAPGLLVGLVVFLSWRRFWIGAVAFTGLGLYYALTTLDRMDWVWAIATPLLVVGLLYALNWRNTMKNEGLIN
jgi:hypothetical protein